MNTHIIVDIRKDHTTLAESWMDKNDSSSTFLNCITEAKLCCANLNTLVVKKYRKMGLDKHGGAM